jgi:hypothetical protein
MPSTLLAEMTFRSTTFVPPMTLRFAGLIAVPWMKMPTRLALGPVPSESVPMKLPAIVLFEELRIRMAVPAAAFWNRLMISPG